VAAALVELESGSRNQILDRCGHTHLARFGGGRDPGAEVNRNATDLSIDQLALSRM
jgi:hypothetical protein